MYYRRGMGDAQAEQIAKVATEAAGSTIMKLAPETGPAAPYVAAVGAVIDLIGSIFSFGYNPEKLNDTRITELAQIEYNALWYALTGENLGGFGQGGCDCSNTPGSCGSMHCAIFNQSYSQYPNVPLGAAGNPSVDVNAIMAQATQIYQQGRQQLQRSQSYADYDANYNGSMAMFQQVLQARQSPPMDTTGSAIDSVAAGLEASSVSSILPWAAIGALTLIALA